MFTVQQIKAEYAEVKSGADFPRYVQAIKALGLVKYEFMVENGQTVYFGADNFQTEAPPIYPVKIINPAASASQLEQTIREHQAGKSDFLTFCKQAACIGVHHWEVNTQSMVCIYYDLNGEKMISEPIPLVDQNLSIVILKRGQLSPLRTKKYTACMGENTLIDDYKQSGTQDYILVC